MCDPGEVAHAVDLIFADGDMQGERGAVLALSRNLAPDPDDLAFSRLPILPQVAVVIASTGLRHEDLDVLIQSARAQCSQTTFQSPG